MASQPPTPTGVGAAAQEEAFEAARLQGFLAPPGEDGDHGEGEGEEIQFIDEDAGPGDAGGGGVTGEATGAAFDYANHPAVTGFPVGVDGARVQGRDDVGGRRGPAQPKAPSPPLTVPPGVPLYDSSGRLLGYQPTTMIRPPPSSTVPQGIPLYDAMGQLMGFQPGPMPTTSRVATTPMTSPTGSGTAGAAGLSGAPSFVQSPVLSGAFMPPPQVIQQITAAGGPFGMILAYLTIPTEICLALLTALEMNINES